MMNRLGRVFFLFSFFLVFASSVLRAGPRAGEASGISGVPGVPDEDEVIRGGVDATRGERGYPLPARGREIESSFPGLFADGGLFFANLTPYEVAIFETERSRGRVVAGQVPAVFGGWALYLDFLPDRKKKILHVPATDLLNPGALSRQRGLTLDLPEADLASLTFFLESGSAWIGLPGRLCRFLSGRGEEVMSSPGTRFSFHDTPEKKLFIARLCEGKITLFPAANLADRLFHGEGERVLALGAEGDLVVLERGQAPFYRVDFVETETGRVLLSLCDEVVSRGARVALVEIRSKDYDFDFVVSGPSGDRLFSSRVFEPLHRADPGRVLFFRPASRFPGDHFLAMKRGDAIFLRDGAAELGPLPVNEDFQDKKLFGQALFRDQKVYYVFRGALVEMDALSGVRRVHR